MPDARPYASLLAKGEDRKARILAAAQRLLIRNGYRGTTLAQVAKEADLSQAGLLHHFESKEQLFHAALDQRDAFDQVNRDRPAELIEQLRRAVQPFLDAPDLVGLYTVLQAENLDPEAPLHARVLHRYRAGVETVAERLRQGQEAGQFRTDIDPYVKAVEITAFLNGIVTSWLLDPSIPLVSAFEEYTSSLARQLQPEPEPGSR